jgi:hypothetical protein
MELVSSWATNKNLQTLCVFLLILTCIFTLNWEYRYHPPVWDTIAGVFSPANYLYETGFNFLSLVKEDGYSKAGPNGHVYSPITILTAATMWAMNGDRSSIFLFLHSVQFTLAAILITQLFNFLKPHFTIINTILILLLVLFFPPFLVQTRYMYMELLGSLCTLTAFTAWTKGKYTTSTLAAVAACATKSFGITLVAALIILFFLDKGRKLNRLYLIIIMCISSIGFEALRWSQGTNFVTVDNQNYGAYLSGQFMSRLLKTPDLYMLIMFILIISVYYLARSTINKKKEHTRFINPLTDRNNRILFGSFLIISIFMGFVITVPLTGKLFYPLTRYYIWIWPELVLSFFLLLKLLLTKKQHQKQKFNTRSNWIITIISISLTTFFLSNSSGRFYPQFEQGLTSFSIAERSMEYQEFNKMQKYLVHSASKMKSHNIYLNRFDTYYTASPIMGYLDKKFDNFKNIITYHKNPGDLAHYPSEFSLILSNVSHGGQYMYALIDQANKDSAVNISVTDTYDNNGFTGLIVKFQKNK